MSLDCIKFSKGRRIGQSSTVVSHASTLRSRALSWSDGIPSLPDLAIACPIFRNRRLPVLLERARQKL